MRSDGGRHPHTTHTLPTCSQMAFTVAVLGTCFVWTLRFGSRRDVVRWVMTISPLYALMLGTSMIALQFSSVGAMTVARNIAPLISLPIEAAFQEKIETTLWTWVSLLYILVGVLVYMSVDMGVGTSTVGMGFVLLNMIAAVVERLMQRKLIVLEPVDLSKTAMLLLNNAFAIIPVALAVPLAPTSIHGRPEYKEYDTWTRLSGVDYFLLVLSCIIGVAIGWTALNAQSYLTATSMLVLTNMNKVRQCQDALPPFPSSQLRSTAAPPLFPTSPRPPGGCGRDQHRVHGGS